MIVVLGLLLLVIVVLVFWYRRKCFTEMNRDPEEYYDMEMEHHTEVGNQIQILIGRLSYDLFKSSNSNYGS